MIKLLMTWSIREGKETEYLEFLNREFTRSLMAMNVHPTDAWYAVWGEGPQVLAGGVTEDLETMERALASDEWKEFQESSRVRRRPPPSWSRRQAAFRSSAPRARRRRFPLTAERRRVYSTALFAQARASHQRSTRPCSRPWEQRPSRCPCGETHSHSALGLRLGHRRGSASLVVGDVETLPLEDDAHGLDDAMHRTGALGARLEGSSKSAGTAQRRHHSSHLYSWVGIRAITSNRVERCGPTRRAA